MNQIDEEFVIIGQQVEHILSNHYHYGFYDCGLCQFDLWIKLMEDE